jgi:hypothetical protein
MQARTPDCPPDAATCREIAHPATAGSDSNFELSTDALDKTSTAVALLSPALMIDDPKALKAQANPERSAHAPRHFRFGPLRPIRSCCRELPRGRGRARTFIDGTLTKLCHTPCLA